MLKTERRKCENKVKFNDVGRCDLGSPTWTTESASASERENRGRACREACYARHSTPFPESSNLSLYQAEKKNELLLSCGKRKTVVQAHHSDRSDCEFGAYYSPLSADHATVQNPGNRTITHALMVKNADNRTVNTNRQPRTDNLVDL